MALDPQGPKHYIFGDYFYSRNARKLRFRVSFLFHTRNYMISSFYSNCVSKNRNISTIFCEFGPLQVKWWHYISASIKMRKYMESELSVIFWVKPVAKNLVLRSPRTHFIYMRVKGCIYISLLNVQTYFESMMK